MRKPLLTVATGQQGVGKSYTTFWHIIYPYAAGMLNGGLARPVLIFDVNDEYGTIEAEDPYAKKLTGGKAVKVKGISMFDVAKYSHINRGEIRRIRPIYTENRVNKKNEVIAYRGQMMSSEHKIQALEHTLEFFRNGLLLIEDISTLFKDSIPFEISNKICNFRHRNQDVVWHLQSVGPMLPRFWHNCSFIRYHNQYDDIEKSEGKVPSFQLFKIADIMVKRQYFSGNERFYVFVDIAGHKVRGNFTKANLVDAIDSYCRTTKSVLKPLLDEKNDQGKEKYTFNAALEIKTQELYKMYNGN